MAGISLGGLSSGLDTQSIIDQLMAIDRAPERRMKLQQSSLQARQQTLTDIGTRLRNLASTVKDLGSTVTWANTQTLEVSDSAKLSAARLSGAAPGGHEVAVTSLARSEQRSYAYTAGDATLTIGAAKIALGATDDGAAAADKINAAADSPVYAVFVKDPLGDTTKDRLVLTRKDTGAFNQADMTVSGADWTSTETYTAGVNAKFTVDGGDEQQSRSNVVTSAVPGLQLTLKSTGTTSVTVSAPGPDQAAITGKVKAFVDQYNSTIDFIRTELNEKRVPNASTDADARKGPLFGDPQLTGLLSQLRSAMSDKTGIGGTIQSLAALGVTTGTGSGGAASADSVAGKLTLDADKLADALTNNRLDVKSFLTDTTKGFATKLTKLLDPVAKVSTGLIDTRASDAGKESSGIDDQIQALEDRISQRQERLQAQFTAMEQALSQSQSQGSWLSAQLR